MTKPSRRMTFCQILAKVAGENAARVEHRARSANWLVKIFPEQSVALRRVKVIAIDHLFTRIPGFAPKIQGAETNFRGVILSISLTGSWGRLHVPLERLGVAAREAAQSQIARIPRKHGPQRVTSFVGSKKNRYGPRW
jgi:hypothetical protein